MTKSELKELIKECLKEVVDPKYTEYSSIPDLTIVSTLTSSDVNKLKYFMLKLHNILKKGYEKDVKFEEKLNTSILPNGDKKIEIKYKIIDIEDDLMLKTVKDNLEDIHKTLKDPTDKTILIDFKYDQ